MPKSMDDFITVTDLTEWIPLRVEQKDEHFLVDWCRLGGKRFLEPFFEDTVTHLLRLPFNQLFCWRTSFETLHELHRLQTGLKPAGFIFHSSRCGSTLVSQMLASCGRNIVISEADPFDAILRSHYRNPALKNEALRAGMLKSLASAFSQRRHAGEARFFIKFDSWNILELPLIKAAFPDVPWVFIYRNPVEVLVSHMRRRGIQMVAGMLEPEMFGLARDQVSLMTTEEYCAKVLGSILGAAFHHLPTGNGLLVNYTELPEAAWTSIAGHFGISWNLSELKAMQDAARLDAKNPFFSFIPDSASKQYEANQSLLDAAENWVRPVYQALEAIRIKTQTK
ncbi:MAG: sulfotransferase [Methylobacter sp.]